MGERGRVKAAFSFTWDRIAMQTRDVYQELLNRNDAPYAMSGMLGTLSILGVDIMGVILGVHIMGVILGVHIQLYWV